MGIVIDIFESTVELIVESIVKPIVESIVTPIIKFAQKILKAGVWTLSGYWIWGRTSGTERKKSDNIDMNDRIIDFKVYKCFIFNGFLMGTASCFTKPLFGSACMHWWVQLKTANGDYYITHFNHSGGDKNYIELIQKETTYEVAEHGRECSRRSPDSSIYLENDIYWIADISQNVVILTLNDIWEFMNLSNWDTYDLAYNNCQNYCIELQQYISKWKVKNHNNYYIEHISDQYYFVKNCPNDVFRCEFKDSGQYDGSAVIRCIFCDKNGLEHKISECVFDDFYLQERIGVMDFYLQV